MVEPRRAGDESEYLTAYQLRELRGEVERNRGEQAAAFGRLERKVDDNLETAVELCNKLDARVTEMEGWRREREQSEITLANAGSKRLTTWQLVGIVVAMLVGAGTLFLMLAAIVVTVMLNS